MAIIRPSNLQTVAPQAAPNVMPRADADIASFGGTQARDQMVAGQQLERASDSLGNIALAEMKDANETRVQDLNNQFISGQQAALYTSPDAFYRLKGADAINGAEKATDKLIELKKQTIDGAANPYQRQRLSAIIDSHFNSATTGISRHVVSEQAAYDKNVAVSSIETATNEAMLDLGKLPVAIERARGAAAAINRGQSEEVISNAQRQAESHVLSNVIRQKIATNDPSAVGMFSNYSDKLDSKDRLALEAAIKTMTLGTNATAFANDRSYDGRLQGYESGKMEFNKLGSGAYGPYQFMKGTWADVRANNPGLNLPADMTAATREQHDAAHSALKAGNAAGLQKAGFEPTPANLYLAHRAGVGGASAILSAAPETPLKDALAKVVPAKELDQWFAQNPDMRGQTAGSLATLASRRMGGIASAPGGTVLSSSDPLQYAVDAATSGRPAPSLERAVNAATGVVEAKPESQAGILNVRKQMIDIEDWRVNKTAENHALYGSNPAVFQANQAAVTSLYEQKKQIINLYKDKLYDSLQDSLTKNPTQMPSAEILSQFDPKQVEQIEKQVERAIAGKKDKTDWQAYTAIQQALTHEDANVREKAAKEQLYQFKGLLADEQYTELLRLQAAVKKGDGKSLTPVQAINGMVNDALLNMNVDPTPKPGTNDAAIVARFHRTVQEELTFFEKEKGKPADRTETQKIIDGAVKKVAVDGWFTRSKSVVNLEYGDIPEKAKADIITEIRSRGAAPTEQRVLQLYKHVLISQPLETAIPGPGPRDRVRMGIEPIGVGAPGSGIGATNAGRWTPLELPAYVIARPAVTAAPLMQPGDYSKRPPRPVPSAAAAPAYSPIDELRQHLGLGY